MPKATILKHDIWVMLNRTGKPRALTAKSVTFAVNIELHKAAYKQLDDDPLLLAKITEAASKEYDNTVKSLTALLKKSDRDCVGAKDKRSREKVAKTFEGLMSKECKSLEKKAVSAVIKAWGDVQKTHAEYSIYKMKAGCDLALDTIGLVGGVAGAVGSGGASLVIGIYSIVKTTVSMIFKVYKLAIDADKMQRRVAKQLHSVQKAFDKNKKDFKKFKAGGKNFSKALVNSLLGADFFATLDSTEGDNDQYKSKLQGVDQASHKVAVELNKLLKDLDKANREIKRSGSKKMMGAMSKVETAVNKSIEKCIAMQKQVQTGMAWQADTGKTLKELKTLQQRGWKVLEKGLPVIDIVLAGGDFKEAGEALLAMGVAALDVAEREVIDRV